MNIQFTMSLLDPAIFILLLGISYGLRQIHLLLIDIRWHKQREYEIKNK